MRQTVFIFSGIAISILVVFELSKYSMFGSQGSRELFVFLFAIAFILIGIVLQRFLTKPPASETLEVNREEAIKKSGLSKQEFTVLTLMAEGLSNNEIANRLFIQESTVKSHVSNILMKLDAKRRTQAVKIGRDLQII
ncbi:MAG: response regulator transcription factor [Bacteroidota bacterium]